MISKTTRSILKAVLAFSLALILLPSTSLAQEDSSLEDAVIANTEKNQANEGATAENKTKKDSSEDTEGQSAETDEANENELDAPKHLKAQSLSQQENVMSEGVEPQAVSQAYTVKENDVLLANSPYDSLSKAVEACVSHNPAGTFVIALSADDPGLGQQVTIPSDITITLTSDGTTRTITQDVQSDSVDQARHIEVLGKLILEDINLFGLGADSTNLNGGIHVVGGTLVMNNSKIEGCYGQNGGGLHAENSTIIMNGSSSISSNKATGSSDSPGGAYLVNSHLTLNGTSAINSNVCASVGGGIYASAESYVVINANATVNNNYTSTYGGGIYSNNSTIFINGGSVSGNEGLVGGGVLITSDSDMIMRNGLISKNTNTHVDQDGAIGGGVAVSSNSTFDMFGGEISNNVADNNGGGVYVHATASGSTATFNMHDGKISQNKAEGKLFANSGFGGGVYLTDVNDHFNMYGGRILKNEAYIGGGIYAAKGRIKIDTDVDATSEISGNKARQGAGLYIDNAKIIKFCKATIDGNTASVSGAGLYHVSGGTVACKLLLEDVSITNNVAERGNAGGVYLYQGPTSSFGTQSQFTFANCNISGNSASGQAGGMYISHDYSANGALAGSTDTFYNFTGTTFEGNTAGTDGGGLNILQSTGIGEYSFARSQFTNNTASQSGGGLYLDGGSYTFTGGKVSMNTAGLQGGGIYLAGPSSFTMQDTGYTDSNTALFGNATDLDGQNSSGDDFFSTGGEQVLVTLIDASLMPLSFLRAPYWAYDTEGARYRNGSSIGNYSPTTGDTNPLALTLSGAFSISYDANGGTGGYQVTVDAGASHVVLTDRAATIGRDGYLFDGWNTRPDGSGDPYAPGTVLTVDAEVTLYAQWISVPPETVSVSYDANGGSGSYMDVVYQSTNYIVRTLENTGIAYDGYTFTGWNTRPDGSGSAYNPGDSYAVNQDLVLYAQWSEMPPGPSPGPAPTPQPSSLSSYGGTTGKAISAKANDSIDPSILIGSGSLTVVAAVSVAIAYRIKSKRNKKQ